MTGNIRAVLLTAAGAALFLLDASVTAGWLQRKLPGRRMTGLSRHDPAAA